MNISAQLPQSIARSSEDAVNRITSLLQQQYDWLKPCQNVSVPVPANFFVLGDRESTARFRQIIVKYFAGVEMNHRGHSILFTIDLKLQNNTEAT